MSNTSNSLAHSDRVDRTVDFQLAGEELITQPFCVVFKHSGGDVAHSRRLPLNAPAEDDKMAEWLVKGFAVKVLKFKFSLAEILSSLLEYHNHHEESLVM
jgi:hypothetical protein